MKSNIIPAAGVVAFLGACGGGGGSVANGPVTTPPPVSTPSSTTIVKQYPSDGSGVAIAEGVPGSSLGTFNAVLVVDDTTKADTHLNAIVLANNRQLTVTSNNNQQPYYQESQTGINSSGETVNLVYFGETLTSGGYVSIGVSSVGNSAALTTDGSRLVSAPAGLYTYRGATSILGPTLVNGVEDGSFTLQANFNTQKASISGQSPSAFYAANSLDINTVSGKISGTGVIGQTGQSGRTATVNGFFAGYAAEGVHGAVYQNADTNDGMGAVFYGSR